MIAEVLNIEPQIDFMADRLGHDKRYALNSTKSFNQLGWAVDKSTEDKFQETVKQLAQISLSLEGKKRYEEMEKFYAN
jgi:dTDP-D-glucose 4,6-dehydratase